MKKAANKKVVPIHINKFLGDYSYAQGSESIREAALFFAGVILTVALPQIICAAYGIVPFTAFAATASAGSLLGWAMYRQAPRAATTFAGTRNAPWTPSSEPAAERRPGKAA